MSTSLFTTVNGHIRGFNNKSRILVNLRKQVVLFAGTLSWVGCIITTTDKRPDGWKKSPVRGVSLATSGTNLFAGTFYGGVFLSTNNGTSWSAVNTA